MPLLILAPMYNVTDTVFRQIVVSCAPPDMLMTEFVNVDGLQSPGRKRLLPYLYQEDVRVPLIAQIWGSQPENYYKTAQELAQRGFAGIDINMGCPDKTVVKNGNCSALIRSHNRPQARAIIQATQAGAGNMPISVKTRLGFSQTDFSWHQFLLEHDLDMLTIHGRTTQEMSKVPARWYQIGHIKEMAMKLGYAHTKIIGNGDIQSRQEALNLCQEYAWDGAMLGRAIFSDPYIFASNSPWQTLDKSHKVDLYLKHLRLFKTTYSHNQRKFDPLKKFMKVYLTILNNLPC